MTLPTLTSPPPQKRRRRGQVVLSAALAAALGITVISVATNASAADTPVSQGKPATASSVESAAFAASAAVDGNAGTRWSSAFADPQWLQVDLGSTQTINQVVLNWEAAFASAFTIQTSPNGTTWSNITPVTAGKAGI